MKHLFQNTIFKGTAILTGAGILSRIIGFYYRIFLGKQIGAKEIGLFQLVIPVFGICFALCSSGIQTAISKFCSAKENKTIWLLSGLFLSVPLSLLFAIYVYIYADFIAFRILLNKDTAPILRVLCFSFPFAAFHNCVNGYYFGNSKTGIPALSQLFEQIMRVGSVYLYTKYCITHHIHVDVFCAVYGNLLGECSSVLICLIALFFEKRHPITFPSLCHCIGHIFSFSFPLTANRLLMHLLQSAEAILIPAQLILYGLSKNEALSIYGVLMGMALPLILFPSAITNSMSVMLLPEISQAQAQNRKTHILRTIDFTLRLCISMGFISSALFLCYGAELGSILFHEPLVKPFIEILAWLCPFYYLTAAFDGILNGLGKTMATCTHNITGIIIRIFSLIFIVPQCGIRGYLYGLLLSQIFICLSHYFCLKKIYPITFHIVEHLIIPAVISFAAILPSFCIYLLFTETHIGCPSLQLTGSACIAALFFLIFFKGYAFTHTFHK